MKLLIYVLLSVLIKMSSSTDIKTAFEKFQVIPDVVDRTPELLLKVEYEGKKVELGKELTPTEVKDHPKITWDADPQTYYTLLMVDPDAPSKNDPKLREVKHWFVGNIKGNDVENGDHITQYLGSGPPKGTGLHRYIFLLYKQAGKLNYDSELRTSNVSRDHRFNFSTKKFVEKYNLGNAIAGNFYEAQWDKYVDERNEQLAKLQQQKQTD